MGEHARGDVGGAPVVGHRPLRPPAAGILLRELSRDRVRVVGVQQLESLRHAPVQQPALRRADLRVCRIAEQIVGEVVAVAELAHDPAAPQLVDRRHDDAGVEVTRLGEQVEGEVRPHRRRQASHLPGGRGRLVEAVAQHGREIAGRQRRAAGIDTAAYRLDDVQREASRRRLEQVHVVRQQRPSGDRLGEPCRVGGVQRAEGQLRHQSGGPHPDRPVSEFGVFVEGVVPQCPGHQDRGVGGQAEEEREERQRLLIAPLHVVQDQQQWPPDGHQCPRQALEEPVALPGIRH